MPLDNQKGWECDVESYFCNFIGFNVDDFSEETP